MSSKPLELMADPAEKGAIHDFKLWAFLKFGQELDTLMRESLKWLDSNPKESWRTLHKSTIEGRVLFENGKLLDLRRISMAKVEELTELLRGPLGVEIKDRRYRLRLYRTCFIGSDAVVCLQRSFDISRPKALRYGELLFEHGVFHHVVREHTFKDRYLFYRFCEDELETMQPDKKLE